MKKLTKEEMVKLLANNNPDVSLEGYVLLTNITTLDDICDIMLKQSNLCEEIIDVLKDDVKRLKLDLDNVYITNRNEILSKLPTDEKLNKLGRISDTKEF